MATNNVLAEQLKATQAELAQHKAKVEKLNKRIAELEAAEKVLLPFAPEPKSEKKEGK